MVTAPSASIGSRRGAPRAWDARFADTSPLFRPLAPGLAALAARESPATFPTPEEIDHALAPLAGVRFVRQAPRPRRARRTPSDPGALYDARITRDGEVPTRADSWHDLLNALVWATFPQAKRALHARQHRLVTPGAPRRTRELDALALLDEGGVVVTSARPIDGDETLLRALLSSGEASVVVFGHAIYEGLVLGWPPATASVLVLAGLSPDAAEADRASVDAALVAELGSPEAFQDPRSALRLTLDGSVVRTPLQVGSRDGSI